MTTVFPEAPKPPLSNDDSSMETLATRIGLTPRTLDLSELDLDSLDFADDNPEATISVRRTVVGDTSIPTIAKPLMLSGGPPQKRPSQPEETLGLQSQITIFSAEKEQAKNKNITDAPSSTSGKSGASLTEEIIPQGNLGFQLGDVIGTGGYGEVFTAVQDGLGRTVAIKRLKSSTLQQTLGNQSTQQWLEFLFLQEAITTAFLQHPNIVPVHQFAKDPEGIPHLAMKLVKGLSWDKIIEQDRGDNLSFSDYLTKHLNILIDVAQAVGFAHAHGVIHRDLKPQQVVVGEFGEVILMDWGLALVYDEARLPASIQGMSHSDLLPRPEDAPSPAGSPAFMAPEQTLRTATQTGPWTDIFMLGGMLYAVLTGTPPYRRDTDEKASDVMRKAAECYVEPPEVRCPDLKIPTELANLSMECMRREPSQRVTSVHQFITRIQDYLSGASRRRESKALSEEVEVLIQAAGRDYHKLSECDNLLDRALFLWPENEQGQTLREQLLQSYAEAAMANDDLALARVQAERLPLHHDARTDLLMEISVLENLASRETYEAREAELALRKADSNRRRTDVVLKQAEQARIAAIESRAFAESLLEHLIEDIASMAADAQPVALAAATGRVVTYFQATDVADITDRMLAQRARTCDRMNKILLAAGRNDDAELLQTMGRDYLLVLQQREASRLRATPRE